MGIAQPLAWTCRAVIGCIGIFPVPLALLYPRAYYSVFNLLVVVYARVLMPCVISATATWMFLKVFVALVVSAIFTLFFCCFFFFHTHILPIKSHVALLRSRCQLGPNVLQACTSHQLRGRVLCCGRSRFVLLFCYMKSSNTISTLFRALLEKVQLCHVYSYLLITY